MADYKAFADLLESVSFSSIDDPQTINESMRKIQSWIVSNISSKLFRYRSFKDESFPADLKINEVWGSSILTFNDPLECTPCVDRRSFWNNFISMQNRENRKRIWEGLRDKSLQPILCKVLQEDKAKQICEDAANCSFEDFLTQSDEFLHMIGKDLKPFISEADFIWVFRLTGMLRNVACFSESSTSFHMWGHYAKGHTGYCLEYDLKQAFSKNEELGIRFSFNDIKDSFISPVIYSEHRFDSTKSFSTFVLNTFFKMIGYEQQALVYPDVLSSFKAVITKAKDWEYEKEWRLVSEFSSEDIKTHSLIANIKPTAVYVGARMSESHEKGLYSVCKQESIPCYKMVVNFLSQEFGMTPVGFDQYLNFRSSDSNENQPCLNDLVC